jgi:hypothetical protein
MSWLGDIFGGDAQAAGQSQIQGLETGMLDASNILNQNPGIITNYGGQALQPFTQNYQTATAGTNQLANLLGLGGASGDASALTSLQSTPGYQFTQEQGNNSINAANAASGTLNSGNQMKALADYDTGLASQTYQNAVGNLNPFLSLLTPSAAGGAGVLGNEASGLVNNNNALAGLIQGTATGVGNAGANADLAKGAAGQGLLGGALSLGSSLLGAGMGGAGGGLSGLLGGLFSGGGGTGGAGAFGNSAGLLDNSFFTG